MGFQLTPRSMTLDDLELRRAGYSATAGLSCLLMAASVNVLVYIDEYISDCDHCVSVL